MDNYTADRRRVFMRLTEKERFEALFEMMTANAANFAASSKLLADARRDIDYVQKELEGFSRRKDDTLTTSEKINAALTTHNAGWLWYRDKVLPGTLTAIQTGIILAVLYLAFRGSPP